MYAEPTELSDFLADASARMPLGAELRQTVLALASAAVKISHTIARGALGGDLSGETGREGGGDAQKILDLHADETLRAALDGSPVACLASEEAPEPVEINAGAPLALAVDPLDGSSNIETNGTIGTIFSLRPVRHGARSFLDRGSGQIAAGFFIYGPQTALVFTLGSGTHIATLDRDRGSFFITARNMRVAPTAREYAINASNERHWSDAIRSYVRDCASGANGPRGADFNTRWVASLVADAYRILIRGGIYLYPADRRKGYEAGRLRLVYEAFPIAMLIEQAGGSATDGETRILDLTPRDIHARTPLVFGARDEVRRVADCLAERQPDAAPAPLFARRGLFRV